MIALLDVNVLIALAWPEHVRHRDAVKWFRKRAAGGWATTPFTQAGFIRLSANAKVVGDPVRPVDSLDLLGQLRTVGAHTFWVDDLDIVISDSFPAERLTGHRQVNDAHLLALSRRWNGSLATFDRGISLLASGLHGTTVELIE